MAKLLPTLYETFASTAQLYPQKPVFFSCGNQQYNQLTYQQLQRKINSAARIFSAHHFRQGDHVALFMDNSELWPIATLALLSLGATIVPINPQSEIREVELLLSDAHVKYIVTSSSLYQRLHEIIQKSSIVCIVLVAEQLAYEDSSASIPTVKASPNDCAFIIYTSGTTATPKGVMLSHKNLLANIDSLQRLGILTKDDTLMCLLPFYHSYPLMVTLLLPLLTGATMSFPATLETQDIARCAKETKATLFIGVPRLFSLLEEKIKQEIDHLGPIAWIFLFLMLSGAELLRKMTNINLARPILWKLHQRFGWQLRYLISGGAKLNESTIRNFYHWGFTLLEGYGLTETSPVVSFNMPPFCKIGTAGKPLVNVDLAIQNPDENGIGEIVVRGNCVTDGYYNDARLTQEKIKNGWLFTGDLGRVDRDGFLSVLGRKDETLILSSGKKINPLELEAYYQQSTFIKELCISVNKEKDTSSETLRAVVVPNYEKMREHAIYQTKDRIRWEIDNCARSLPAYKRIASISISNESLPRTVLGKLKRYQIQERLTQLITPDTSSRSFTASDTQLLEHPLCKKAYDFICEKAKRSATLNETLSDLGFDSLEQVILLVEFQKIATSISLDELNFNTIPTIRDILQKLEKTSPQQSQAASFATSSSWSLLLTQSIPEAIKNAVRLQQSLLEKFLNMLLASIFRLIFFVMFRVEVKNTQLLPKTGPLLLCPNHGSFLDGPLIFASLPQAAILNTFFVGYKAYMNHPVLRWSKKLLRFIAIDASMEVTESLQTCHYVLSNNKMLCIFPEGMRSSDGAIQELKKGVGIIIKELNVPVVPVYIKGNYQAWSRYQLLPKPHKITIIIGSPVSVEELSRSEQNLSADIDIYSNIMHNLRGLLIKLQNS